MTRVESNVQIVVAISYPSPQLTALCAEDSYELDLFLTARTTLSATTPGDAETGLIGRRPVRPVVNVKHYGHNPSQ